MSEEKLSGMDYSQTLFFSELVNQTRYDREIDEGMSSGMKRYATLDVTKLSENQVTGVLENLLISVEGFNMCKVVQVAGFNKKGKRYLIVSGESHLHYQSLAVNSMLGRIRDVTSELPVEYVADYVKPPVEGESHETVNLGRYGSTGAPAQGISQHPGAEDLRSEKKIR